MKPKRKRPVIPSSSYSSGEAHEDDMDDAMEDVEYTNVGRKGDSDNLLGEQDDLELESQLPPGIQYRKIYYSDDVRNDLRLSGVKRSHLKSTTSRIMHKLHQAGFAVIFPANEKYDHSQLALLHQPMLEMCQSINDTPRMKHFDRLVLQVESNTMLLLHPPSMREIPCTPIYALAYAQHAGIGAKSGLWRAENTAVQVKQWAEEHGDARHPALLPEPTTVRSKPWFARGSIGSYRRRPNGPTNDFEFMQQINRLICNAAPSASDDSFTTSPTFYDYATSTSSEYTKSGTVSMTQPSHFLISHLFNPRRLDALKDCMAILARCLLSSSPQRVSEVVPVLIELDPEQHIPESNPEMLPHFFTPPQFAMVITIEDGPTCIVPVALNVFGNLPSLVLNRHFKFGPNPFVPFSHGSNGKNAGSKSKADGTHANMHEVYASMGWHAAELLQEMPNPAAAWERLRGRYNVLHDRLCPILDKFKQADARILRVDDVCFPHIGPMILPFQVVESFADFNFENDDLFRYVAPMCVYGHKRYSKTSVLWPNMIEKAPEFVASDDYIRSLMPFQVCKLSDFELKSRSSLDVVRTFLFPTTSKRNRFDLPAFSDIDDKPACHMTPLCPLNQFAFSPFCEPHAERVISLAANVTNRRAHTDFSRLPVRSQETLLHMMKVWRNGQRSGFKITDLEFHVLRKPWHQMVWQLAVVGIEAGDTLLEANIDYGLNFKETLQHIYEVTGLAVWDPALLLKENQRFTNNPQMLRNTWQRLHPHMGRPSTHVKTLSQASALVRDVLPSDEEDVLITWYGGNDRAILHRMWENQGSDELIETRSEEETDSHILRAKHFDLGPIFKHIFPYACCRLGSIYEVVLGRPPPHTLHLALSDCLVTRELALWLLCNDELYEWLLAQAKARQG